MHYNIFEEEGKNIHSKNALVLFQKLEKKVSNLSDIIFEIPSENGKVMGGR